MSIFGYFDRPSQTEPAFDPGMRTICPVCMLVLGRPVVTVDLWRKGDNRSYFYRMHKSCAENPENRDEIRKIESSLVDSIDLQR